MHLIEKLFRADAAAPPNAVKLDGTTETILTHSLSVLSPDERGWVTFAEARISFSTKDGQYAFGETEQNGARVKSVLAQPTVSQSLSKIPLSWNFAGKLEPLSASRKAVIWSNTTSARDVRDQLARGCAAGPGGVRGRCY